MKRYLVLGTLAVFGLMASACGGSETSTRWTEVVSMTAGSPTGDVKHATSVPFTLSGRPTIVRIMLDESGDHTYQGVEGDSGSAGVYVLLSVWSVRHVDSEWKPSTTFSVSLNQHQGGYETRVGPAGDSNPENPDDVGVYPAGDYRMRIEVQNATVTASLLEES